MKRLQYILLISGFMACGQASAEELAFDPHFPLCGEEPALPTKPDLGVRDYAPDTTIVTADEAEGEDNGLAKLRGNVEIARGDQALRADQANYDKPKEILDAGGHVRFWDPKLFWEGTGGFWNIKQNLARFDVGAYKLLNFHGRGHADSIKFDRETKITHFRQVDYTTCSGEWPGWKLKASYLKIDHNTDRGQASNATLRVFNVPILYFPWISFPTTNERKSGLLTPFFGHFGRYGFNIYQPYYWNIAPNQDATFGPRYLQRHGLMAKGQYRYLFGDNRLLPFANGKIEAEVLPEDSQQQNHDSRYLLSIMHNNSFAKGRGHAQINFTRVSDVNYFSDFGTTLSLTSRIFLEQRGDISYTGNSWYVLGRLQDFQSVNPALSPILRPYNRLPQVLFNAAVPSPWHGLNLAFNSEAVYFSNSNAILRPELQADPNTNQQFVNNERLVTGARLDLKPSISYPIRKAGGFFIPKLSLRYTRYFLDNVDTALNQSLASIGGTSFNDFVTAPSGGGPNSVLRFTTTQLDRSLPIASLDTGLTFERDINLANTSFLQTLEPRLFYLYIPYRNQNNLPNFDSARYDFSIPQLFRENRFAGTDRIGDANQVSVALTSRLIDRSTGLEHLRASIGQTINFQDRRVTLFAGQPVEKSTFSETIADVTARITNTLTTRGSVVWNSNNGDFLRGTVGMRYRPSPYTVFNFDYRVRKNRLELLNGLPLGYSPLAGVDLTPINQTDVSFRWAATMNWALLGRWNYDFSTNATIDAFGGFEYNGCCFGMSFVLRRYITSSNLATFGLTPATKPIYDTGFFIILNFKGLGGLGNESTKYLRKTIPSYQNEYDRDDYDTF